MKSNRNNRGKSEDSTLRGVPRREFLAGLAALGASALLPEAISMAQSRSANWRIDTMSRHQDLSLKSPPGRPGSAP
jgi:hypothetical protein